MVADIEQLVRARPERRFVQAQPEHLTVGRVRKDWARLPSAEASESY
jgi:hypothetical protein